MSSWTTRDSLKRFARWLGFIILAIVACTRSSTADDAALGFNRAIRPLLADHCFACHGPDRNQRKADLRLDTREGLLGTPDAPGPVVPGSAQQSSLWQRIHSDDPDQQMPPPGTRPPLTDLQKELIKKWIESGASWQEHWSFTPLSSPEIPGVSQRRWLQTGVDAFIAERHERERCTPSPAASRSSLIRRASLDITGIPPTPNETDDFCNAEQPDSFERLTDRLLASPRYGERIGMRWLDAARYADTSGYQNDGPRFMWRWRDWVLQAFNHDLPFDQFTIEQIAGDLLPNASTAQRIATGFNRNHRGNSEGGIIPEEFAVEYVVDRVDTTATVWLGLTMGCARCHEHKFDPISQREFYQLFAFFNNIPEYGRAIKEGNSPPLVVAPTEEDSRVHQQLKERLRNAEIGLRDHESIFAKALERWTTAWPQKGQLEATDWNITDGLVLRLAFEKARDPQEPPWQVDPAVQLDASRPTKGVFGEALALDGRGMVILPVAIEGKEKGTNRSLGDFGYFDPFTISAWIYPHAGHGGTIVSKMTDTPQGDGYAVQLVQGRLQVNLVKRWLDDALRLETEDELSADTWHHIAVVYDGTRVSQGITVYVDGAPQRLRVHLDALNQTFATSEPLRIGGGGGESMRFHGRIDEVRLYERSLEPIEVRLLANAAPIDQLLSRPASQRDATAQEKLRRYYLERVAAPEVARPWRAWIEARRALEALERQLPTVMVMEEMPTPRPTFVLLRGEYDKPGDPVTAGVPAFLPPLDPSRRNDRLALASWLVDERNPLTARVAANRAWQMLFGAGIVRTVEDFGTQSDPPSHPELLDWLALRLRHHSSDHATGAPWSFKRFYRLLLLSATYQQSSAVREPHQANDSANRLFTRGPRFRMPAEMIRDQALAAAGLLVERIGGPSVKPYQPADLWKELATDTIYQQSHGGDLFRRGIYTYWKRTVAPPNLTTFDAATRETCVVREFRTNTPLQALTLLNEITFVESARNLAQQSMMEGGPTVSERISDAFRRLLTRTPTAEELRILVEGWHAHHARFRADPAAARELLEIGESQRAANLDLIELAAYTATCSVLLSLDETITRN